MNGNGMTKLVKRVQSLCDDALQEIDDDFLGIRIDLIDAKNFLEL